MKKGREICHFGLTSYPRGGYSLYYGLNGVAPPGTGGPFSGFRYMEGWGVQRLKYVEG